MSDTRRIAAIAAQVLRGLGVFLLLWPLLPPLFRLVHLDAIADAVGAPWAISCHRDPERTLSLFGSKMPMCSRCMGISIGAGAGLLLGRPYRGPGFMWVWLAAATAFMLVDVYEVNADHHHVFHPSRIATGLLLAFPVAAAASAIARRESKPAAPPVSRPRASGDARRRRA